MSSRRNTQRSTIRWMKASPACGLLALLIGNITAAAQAPASLTLNEALARAVEANRAVLAARSARAIDLAARPGRRPAAQSRSQRRSRARDAALGVRRRGAARSCPASGSGASTSPTRRSRSPTRRPRGSPPTCAATCAAPITRSVAAVRRVDIAQELESDRHARARCRAGALSDRRRAASRGAPGAARAGAGRRTNRHARGAKSRRRAPS